MGNATGLGYDFGNIYVRTDKPYYFSGELVTGFPAKDLILKIKGYEYCKWDEVRYEKVDEQNTRKVIDYHEGEKEFFKQIVPLYKASLPGSYEEKVSGQEGQNYEAYVKYIDQGSCKIKCYFDKNAYLPGEQSYLQIDFDNSQCKLNITQFVGKLERSLTLRSNNGKTRQLNHVMNSIQMPDKENDKLVLGGAPPVTIKMAVPLINAKSSDLDQTLKPQTNGSIVDCTYSLSGQGILDGCTCCSDKPEIIVPVSIISPIPNVYNVVPQLQNWNPQVFPVQSVQWGNNYSMQQQYQQPVVQQQQYQQPVVQQQQYQQPVVQQQQYQQPVVQQQQYQQPVVQQQYQPEVQQQQQPVVYQNPNTAQMNLNMQMNSYQPVQQQIF